MDTTTSIAVMSALAQPTRLAAVTELLRAGDAGLPAGELAARISASPNSMSVHLAILTRAGVVSQSKSGRTVTCRAVRARVAEIGAFLTSLSSDAA